MDAYTSGPWQVNTDSRGLFITITNHQSVPVADRIGDTATAALIAAAPDLLAALQMALDASQNCIADRSWEDAAIAAIEAATKQS